MLYIQTHSCDQTMNFFKLHNTFLRDCKSHSCLLGDALSSLSTVEFYKIAELSLDEELTNWI